MVILFTFAVLMGVLITCGAGELVAHGATQREKLPRKTYAQGLVVVGLLFLATSSWLPLFQDKSEAYPRCGMEGFFLLAPPLLLSASLLGALVVWLFNWSRLKDLSENTTEKRESEWRVLK